MKNIILFSIVIFTISGCKSYQHNNNRSVVSEPLVKTQFPAALPHIVIYKTTNDYSHKVPVLLSDDKMHIISYPHPTDLIFSKNLALPTLLHGGYYLDNKGIGKNVAFLKFTYEEYSKLKDVPTLEELYNNIIDKDPLTELWDCGEKANFTDIQKLLNKWIDKNLLPEKCKQIR
jgi:hypothetical protein